MTLFAISLQQAFSRPVVIARSGSDEAIQKVVDFWIASSLPLLAMTTGREKACCKDIAKSVIVSETIRKYIMNDE
jgi:hypothetical protein